MVGKTGFEPATPWSQTKCSTKLSYFPRFIGYKIMARPAGVESTTFLIRSQVLYPIELRAHKFTCNVKWCREPESNRYGSYLPQDFKSCASASSATPANQWSGRRDSNPRPPPWQGDILPLNYFRVKIKCG